MGTQDFTVTTSVEQTPMDAYNAINNVRGWWSEEIEGDTDKLNGIFDYHYEDVHRCKIEVIEMIPGNKIVWRVLENYFKFTEDEKGWTGTTIVFDITANDGKTLIRMTHHGLVPAYECFNICSDSWTNYIQKSLHNLITKGKGKPDGKDKPQTENEKNLATK